MRKDPMDSSGFVLLSDYVPGILQEIRYFSTYNFIGDRIDGYEEPCALLTKEAARALKSVSNQLNVQGYRLKVFDAYRPANAVQHFVLWGIEDTGNSKYVSGYGSSPSVKCHHSQSMGSNPCRSMTF